NRFADWWNRAEQLPLHLGADERDAAAQTDVILVEEASARLRFFRSHLSVGRGDAANEVAGLLVPVDDGELLHEFGGDILHERQFAERHHIVGRDAHALAGALATRLQAGLT